MSKPLIKSCISGSLATVADLAVLTLLVQFFKFAPETANLPSLLVGASVQFLLCRGWVFRAHSGSIARQLGRFILTEFGTIFLNATLFQFFVSLVQLPYLGARLLSAFLVFLTFSYPIWKRTVFLTEESY